MATYTTLDHQSLQACLNQVHLGELLTFKRAGLGIENSNYLLTVLQQGEKIPCVLTVYEELPKEQVEIYTQCLKLWGNHLPVPLPLHDAPLPLPGRPGKTFVIYTRLSGEHVLCPQATHCKQVGQFLAQFHLKAQSTPLSWIGRRSIPWVLGYRPTDAICSNADIEQFKTYQAQLNSLPNLLKDCPKGWVHGDLFPDNALFERNELCGVIDFNNACVDVLLLDLCITLNAWSSLGVEHSCPERFTALLNGYTEVRPLTDAETSAMPLTMLAAALRFWGSRIDFTLETGGKTGKEPQEYQRLAQYYSQQLESKIIS